jgi:hypothetical protein
MQTCLHLDLVSKVRSQTGAAPEPPLPAAPMQVARALALRPARPVQDPGGHFLATCHHAQHRKDPIYLTASRVRRNVRWACGN